MLDKIIMGLLFFVSLVPFFILIPLFLRMKDKPKRILISYYVMVVQYILSFLSIYLTINNSISTEACMLGIFGFYGCVCIAGLEAINLMSLAYSQYRRNLNISNLVLSSYVLLRIITLVHLTAIYYFNALSCSV